MRAIANRNFHLPLSPALYADLRAAAERAGTPATDVAREAIQAWLRQERRREIHEELRAFAEEFAGTEWDLDPQFEAAGLESIAKLPPWPNPPKFEPARTAHDDRPAPRRKTAPKTTPARSSLRATHRKALA